MIRPAFLRFSFVVWLAVPLCGAAEKIDREAVVTRHNPKLTKIDPWAPLSVGNGQFCFTADVTGLQTFYDHYQKNGIPLETLARWAWHMNPNPQGYRVADANSAITAYGKTIGYPTQEKTPAGKWLRENPHDMPLGQLGFVDERGAPLDVKDISAIDQELDLWNGELRSRFAWRGTPVEVSTVAIWGADGIAVRVTSRALAEGKLRLRLAFPRGHDIGVKNNPTLDWSQPATHTTRRLGQATPIGTSWADDQPDPKPAPGDRGMGVLTFARLRDAFRYGSSMVILGFGRAVSTQAHEYVVRAQTGEETLELTWMLAERGAPDLLEGWPKIRADAAKVWPKFWESGGAIDFAGSTDPRANELERRVVLSQYLTAIQFAGVFPPQETGLTLSSWYGKHHTEMIWWHTAHFALWGRSGYVAKNLRAFITALPKARELAWERGLRGARWPKMVGWDWWESPGGNPLIVWNQPHPIHLAELLYRNDPTETTIKRYRELVQETAECMASMLHWDVAQKRYNLGPPLWIAQEIYDRTTSMNPTYELSYWSRGLKIAQQWRERQRLPRNAEWDRMIKGIAALPQKDGKYVALESTPDTWDNLASRHDHPSFLMALGQLPGDGVDRAVMARTLDAVLTSWDWETKIWGWDYPMVAMTAARLGEPKKAVDVLLKSDGPNNKYTANGHNPQRADLPVYLPGNGALLAAVALMAAGWDGAPKELGEAPGFPKDGTWVVRSEGLKPLP
jgi:hypothetical protein